MKRQSRVLASLGRSAFPPCRPSQWTKRSSLEIHLTPFLSPLHLRRTSPVPVSPSIPYLLHQNGRAGIPGIPRVAPHAASFDDSARRARDDRPFVEDGDGPQRRPTTSREPLPGLCDPERGWSRGAKGGGGLVLRARSTVSLGANEALCVCLCLFIRSPSVPARRYFVEGRAMEIASSCAALQTREERSYCGRRFFSGVDSEAMDSLLWNRRALWGLRYRVVAPSIGRLKGSAVRASVPLRGRAAPLFK